MPWNILSFVIFRTSDRCDKQTSRYYQFLPVLSKSFRSIINDIYSQDVKYPLHVNDNPIKTIRKAKKVKDSTYDASTVHIYAEHTVNSARKLEAMHLKPMHLKPMKFKTTKTIKRVAMLNPINIFQSSLPW
eukprot:118452_1